MISLTAARREIKRLESRIGYPKYASELDLMVQALRIGARGQEHATAAITEALQASDTHCPTPDDLRRICGMVGTDAELPDGCDLCREHPGWRRVQITRKAQIYEGMARCTCALGRQLEARENQERAAEGRPPMRVPHDAAVRTVPPPPDEPREYGLCFDPEEFARIMEREQSKRNPLKQPKLLSEYSGGTES